jgi:hypothetical protein
MGLFRGRRKRAERRVTIKPDGSVDLTGYPLGEMIRLSQQKAFRDLMQDARENPPVKAEIRDVEFR